MLIPPPSNLCYPARQPSAHLQRTSDASPMHLQCIYIFSKEKIALSASVISVADVNADGSITAQDASLILQKVAGKVDW